MVILAEAHAFRAKIVMQRSAAIWQRIDPPLHRLEHRPMDLNRVLANRRMVEHPHAIVHYLIDRHTWILPRVKNPRRHVLQDLCRHSASGWIQYITEMVFTQHAVRWVSTIGVIPGRKLVPLGRFNDAT